MHGSKADQLSAVFPSCPSPGRPENCIVYHPSLCIFFRPASRYQAFTVRVAAGLHLSWFSNLFLHMCLCLVRHLSLRQRRFYLWNCFYAGGLIFTFWSRSCFRLRYVPSLNRLRILNRRFILRGLILGFPADGTIRRRCIRRSVIFLSISLRRALSPCFKDLFPERLVIIILIRCPQAVLCTGRSVLEVAYMDGMIYMAFSFPLPERAQTG